MTVPAIVDLIRRPYVAELLASLDAQPLTLTDLRLFNVDVWRAAYER